MARETMRDFVPWEDVDNIYIQKEASSKYEAHKAFSVYEQQYKKSQEAIRKYAEDVRKLTEILRTKDAQIKKLKKQVGRILSYPNKK